jgi:hypothetical protein
MRKIKILITGIVIGGLVGLWFGFNIGKQRPVYANPFTDPEVSSRIENTGEEAVQDSGQALEQAGEQLQEKAREKQQ